MRRILSHRTPSFSLIEMIVVLLLSSIVVGVVYSTFLTVTKYQMDLTRRARKSDDLTSVYFLIKKDFERSIEIELQGENGLVCTAPLSLQIDYVFADTYILRKQGARSDTFHCKLTKPEFRLEGKMLEKPGRLDELRVAITDLSYPASIVVKKEYDAASLVQLIKSDTIQ